MRTFPLGRTAGRGAVPAAIGSELRTSGDETRVPAGSADKLVGVRRGRGPRRVARSRSSRNSAFTAVRVSDGGPRSTTRAQGARGGAWFGTSDGGGVGGVRREQFRRSVERRFARVGIVARGSSRGSGGDAESRRPNNQQHRLSQSNAGPAFSGFRCCEGDSAPESPATDDPDEAEGEATTTTRGGGDGDGDEESAPASTTRGHEDEMRCSASAIRSARSARARRSLSLRGGIGGGDEDGAPHGDDYSDSDFDDAGTAVTGTTTGADPDGWAPPTRWGAEDVGGCNSPRPGVDDGARLHHRPTDPRPTDRRSTRPREPGAARRGRTESASVAVVPNLVPTALG